MGAPGEGYARAWRARLFYRTAARLLYWVGFVVVVLALFSLGGCEFSATCCAAEPAPRVVPRAPSSAELRELEQQSERAAREASRKLEQYI